MGIVYLIQPAELIGTNRYKIGCSNDTRLKRLTNGYKIGTSYNIIMECKKPFKMEKQLINLFINKYKLIAGREYFEGNKKEMISTFYNTVSESNDSEINKDEINEDEINEDESNEDEINEDEINEDESNEDEINEDEINEDESNEDNLWTLCCAVGEDSNCRTHYAKCTNLFSLFSESEFLCETSNGFIQILLDKHILEVGKEFNIYDEKILKKIEKQKNILNIENFPDFCSIYGEKSINTHGMIEEFFDDTKINGKFYALSMEKFKKNKWKNFEARSFYISCNSDELLKKNYPNYGGWINLYNNNSCISIICINDKLFCKDIFPMFIPREICIDGDKGAYIFGGREYDYIGFPGRPKLLNGIEYNFKCEYLCDNGKYPWTSQENYNSYFTNLRKYELYKLKNLNPVGSLNLFENFKK